MYPSIGNGRGTEQQGYTRSQSKSNTAFWYDKQAMNKKSPSLVQNQRHRKRGKEDREMRPQSRKADRRGKSVRNRIRSPHGVGHSFFHPWLLPVSALEHLQLEAPLDLQEANCATRPEAVPPANGSTTKPMRDGALPLGGRVRGVWISRL